MTTGTMSSDANYPSNNGIPINTVSLLGGFTASESYACLSISKTPGTTASYKLQTLVHDTFGSQWVDVANTTISGDGAAATGQVVTRVIGESVRVAAVNGTGPGTGANTPTYTLNLYPVKDQDRVHYAQT